MDRALDLEALANLGELVGAIAVVASLAYLAYQVRQNTQSLRTENYARALERVASIQGRLSSDGAFAAIFTRGALDPASLRPEERVQFAWAFYEMFGAFEFMFHQAETKALPPDVWERWSDTLSWWISLPGVHAWWQARPAPFTEAFARHVDARRAGGPADREAARRWDRFLRGGPAPDLVPPRPGA